MKLKRLDLELLMQYLEKEKPEFVDVTVGEMYQVKFGFLDADKRDCEVVLWDAAANAAPDLHKKMKLHTRVKKV